MKRWERTECGKQLNKTNEWVWYIRDEYFPVSLEEWKKTREKTDLDNPAYAGACCSDYILTLMDFALFTHFEVPNSFPSPKFLVSECISKATAYFFGEWREDFHPSPDETYGVQECRTKIRWMREYRTSILAALLMDDVGFVQQLAGWVGSDLGTWGDYDLTSADVDWYVLLGRFLSGKTLAGQNELCQKIEKSSKRRPKMNLEILESIDKEDTKRFSVAIKKKVKHFVKSDVDSHVATKPILLLDFDASILWNLAEQRKMDMPSLGDEVMDRIATRKTMGLEK